MTYAEFSQACRNNAFPEGEAPNLITRHKDWVRDGLIELQQKVKCLQTRHTNIVAQSAMNFHCGASVFEAPKGFIGRLYTKTTDANCDKVFYHPISYDEMECELMDLYKCGGTASPYGYWSDVDGNEYLFPSNLPLDLQYSDSGLDKVCRATIGYYTLHRGNLYLFPHLDSNEVAIFEWDGVKRSWGDDDIVEWDREISNAIEMHLSIKAAWKDDEDREDYLVSKQELAELIQRLIWQCKKEERLPKRKFCYYNCGVVSSTPCYPLTRTVTQIVESQTTTTASGAGVTFRTFAEARAYSDFEDLKAYMILGAFSVGDGGGGWFWYDASSFLPDDGGTVLKPNELADSSAGRLRRA